MSNPDRVRLSRKAGRSRVRWRATLLAGLLGLTIAACGSPADVVPAQPGAKAAPAKFTLGLISQSASQWPAYVMLDEDIDARHGLAIEPVQTGGSSNSIQQTLAGEVDAGEAPVERAIQVATERRAKLRMICASELYYSSSVVASPDITSIEQLRGKRISVVSKDDSTYYLLQELLERHGISAKAWVPVFTAANSATRYAALKAKSVDAVVVASPLDLKAEDEGNNVVVDLGEEFPDFAFTSFVATEEALRTNKPRLRQFVAAYAEAIDWLLDPANEQRATAILASNTKLDPQTTKRLYSLLITEKRAFAKNAVIPAESIKVVQERLAHAGLISQVRSADKFSVDLVG
ncbi:ABC transporter substrate-binding protein [Streptomyces chiangmaiensis]|uniref:ABC transporter substrate-binding protein n=1 Tax=Streptomyces chiangmaiensis TaxID=766497 RepID=A0ABU7FMA3_9ACTN|nr:ABC transporter substrate-binding protein [Streptomyces chiangmaiensis]MED7825261.1 ABC transporter substrate-binding protein [Streptomyces chiangmaiensis]